MIDALSALLRWLLIVLVLAAAAHYATVLYLPNFFMARAMDRIAKVNGLNKMSHGRPPDEKSRAVVRPSPDLVYSSCVFNLTQTNLRIRGPVPKEGYWSLSLFAANTDNFFVVNNSEFAGEMMDYLITGPGTYVRDAGGATVIEAPSFSGIALIRILNEGPEALAALDPIRKQATCEPVPR